MPYLLNRDSAMQCPHGGTVKAVPGSDRVRAGGAVALRATDGFAVAQCPFPPGGPPHPCAQIRWVQPAARSTATGGATLTEASIGQCLAGDGAVQGLVVIVATQSRVAGV